MPPRVLALQLTPRADSSDARVHHCQLSSRLVYEGQELADEILGFVVAACPPQAREAGSGLRVNECEDSGSQGSLREPRAGDKADQVSMLETEAPAMRMASLTGLV